MKTLIILAITIFFVSSEHQVSAQFPSSAEIIAFGYEQGLASAYTQLTYGIYNQTVNLVQLYAFANGTAELAKAAPNFSSKTIKLVLNNRQNSLSVISNELTEQINEILDSGIIKIQSPLLDTLIEVMRALLYIGGTFDEVINDPLVNDRDLKKVLKSLKAANNRKVEKILADFNAIIAKTESIINGPSSTTVASAN